MDFSIIATSVLAGGIVGQILTIIGTHYFTNKREYKKWRLTERYKAITEIIDILTSNPNGEELQEWTYKIRNVSMKIHILYKSGKAPAKLSHALEVVFRLAQDKKDDKHGDQWATQFRSAVSVLRKELSQNINID